MKTLTRVAAITLMTSVMLVTPAGADSQNLASKKQLIEKSLSDFSYTLSLQAADWGLPIVIMYNLRYNDALKAGAKSSPNHIWRLEDITSPELAAKAGYVTPNVNVIYGFGFLDLQQEPVILTAPDSNNRYYMIQIVDMYTNSFAYVGGVATGYKGGKFAIVGPGWQGTLPADVTRIDAPTRWVLIQPRVHVINEADLPQAKIVLNDITVKGLSDYLGKPAMAAQTYQYINPEFTNPDLPVSAVDFKDPLQFWKILSAAINENPPPAEEIKGLLPMFKLLGIEFGKQWEPGNISPIILDAMKRAAQNIGPLNSNLPVGEFVNNWFMPPPAIGNAQNNYYLRAIVARVGLTANTPEEAIYFMGTTDSTYAGLMSGKNYTVTFKQLPPYIKPGFWSLTLYNGVNNYTVSNPINRYSLGNDNQMSMNADGALTIYIQSASPGKDKESNWLPSGSGNQPFYLILRSYAPGEAMIKSLSDPQIYSPPPVIEVK